MITLEDLIGQFKTKYLDLIRRDAWLAKSTTQDQASAFVAQTGSSKGGGNMLICFNCGGCHGVPDCPQPRNEEAIKACHDLILNFCRRKMEVDQTIPTLPSAPKVWWWP